MGQAFDEQGNVLAEAYGKTKREVFDSLIERVPEAHEIRIKTLKDRPDETNTARPMVTVFDDREPYPIPSIGRIVHYRLSADDAAQINRRRTTGKSIADRIMLELDRLNHERDADVHAFAWPAGAQAHIGNEVSEGDLFPMLIVRVWGNTPTSAVSGQVFLDGNDVFWATSRMRGDQDGTFSWPTRS